LRGSRCTVRGDESDAAPLPHTAPEPNSGGLSQRFLRLDSAAALPEGKGRNTTGSGNQGSTQADSGDVGADRLQRELVENGIRAGICRIKRIKRKLCLRCKQKRKFKVTTDSKHKLPVAENLLKQQFTVCEPNAVWVSDITYVPTDEGWL